ncbi:MAG: hypothetical protein ABEJ28_00470 [Salinigranum sp.]
MTEEPFGVDLSKLAELEDQLPLDAVFGALSDPIARYALYYLVAEESASLDGLADVVAGWMNASDDAVATPADRDRVRLLLFHVHLPKLDDAELLRFDPGAKEATAVDLPEEFLAMLERLRRIDERSRDGPR